MPDSNSVIDKKEKLKALYELILWTISIIILNKTKRKSFRGSLLSPFRSKITNLIKTDHTPGKKKASVSLPAL